jgi:hypothetical protein
MTRGGISRLLSDPQNRPTLKERCDVGNQFADQRRSQFGQNTAADG